MFLVVSAVVAAAAAAVATLADVAYSCMLLMRSGKLVLVDVVRWYCISLS